MQSLVSVLLIICYHDITIWLRGKVTGYVVSRNGTFPSATKKIFPRNQAVKLQMTLTAPGLYTNRAYDDLLKVLDTHDGRGIEVHPIRGLRSCRTIEC